MNVEVAANKRFLDTSAADAAKDWDELLISQVDLSIAGELSMLLGLEPWRRAKRVIDAGCGNGYYLATLRSFFPEKAYLGIDISPEMIAAASLRHPDIAFETADYFAADAAPADVVVMRFLVQHLGDFDAILRRTRRLLRPGGVLIIVESDLARSLVQPMPPVFHRMLTTYARVSAADGSVKERLLGDAAGLIASSGEAWHLTSTAERGAAMVGPFDGKPLMTVFGKWVDLAERSGMFAYDFDAVREELAAWARGPAILVSLATRMFVLQPTE